MFNRTIIVLILQVTGFLGFGQETRYQYPGFLRNSYTGVSVGYINYSFSQSQLQPGYAASSISVPHAAVRVILFGHHFTPRLSAEIGYMRPVNWVDYKNVNGSGRSHLVGMNIGSLTVRAGVPIAKRWRLNAEGGLALITRSGFYIDDAEVVNDATYGTAMAGGSLGYHLGDKWEFAATGLWSPARKNEMQPATTFFSLGFRHSMRGFSAEQLKAKSTPAYFFPRNIIQLGVSTNVAGYGVNNLFSRTIPVFWGGQAHVRKGLALQYQRNIFHSRKVFSFDWGVTAGWWQSRNSRDNFYSLAVFPLFRFTALRTKAADLYFNYSLAGPAFISKTIIDGANTGRRFTFQDFMGIGIFAGKQRKINADIRIGHFSNGNIFPSNDGVKVPLTLSAGVVF